MKKITLLFLLIISSLVSAQSKIDGVVTYYFNSNLGDKPDTGAKVILIDSLKMNNNFESFFLTYKKASRIQKELSDSEFLKGEFQEQLNKTDGKKRYKDQNEKFKNQIADYEKKIVESKKELSALNVNSKEEYEALCSNLSELTRGIENEFPTKTVDGVGRYTFENVKNGTYYILIRSKNRNYTSSVEILGQLFLKKVIITENESVDVSNNFYL